MSFLKNLKNEISIKEQADKKIEALQKELTDKLLKSLPSEIKEHKIHRPSTSQRAEVLTIKLSTSNLFMTNKKTFSKAFYFDEPTNVVLYYKEGEEAVITKVSKLLKEIYE